MRSDRALVWTCFLTAAIGALLSLLALALGFQVEGTAEANAEAEHGQAVGIPAVLALVSGTLGLVLQRRPTALKVCAAISAVTALWAVVAYAVG